MGGVKPDDVHQTRRKIEAIEVHRGHPGVQRSHGDARKPEREIATELIGNPGTANGIADFFWAIVNLPEFQLIN